MNQRNYSLIWQQFGIERALSRRLQWLEDWPPLRWLDYLGSKSATILGLIVGGAVIWNGFLPAGPLHYGWLGFGIVLGLGLVISAKPVVRWQAIPLSGESLLDMMLIRSGYFRMGSPIWQEDRYGSEQCSFVKLTPFWMGRTPVTAEQYRHVMGECPGDWGASHPATKVSWFDAIDFCNRLSALEGLLPCYQIEGRRVRWVADAGGYRLPTEAEWECAARAGSGGPWPFPASELGEHAWYFGNSGRKPHPVAELKPNPWGLFDMHGNVWEWCWDLYSYYGRRTAIDPRDPRESGSDPPEILESRARLSGDRVLRGGSFDDVPENVRSADRGRARPEDRYRIIGFRCVRRSPFVSTS